MQEGIIIAMECDILHVGFAAVGVFQSQESAEKIKGNPSHRKLNLAIWDLPSRLPN